MAHIATCIAHSEQLFRVLAVAFATERFGHGKAELKTTVVVRFDLTVASLAAGCGMGGVLQGSLDNGRYGIDVMQKYFTHLDILESHERAPLGLQRPGDEQNGLMADGAC